MPERELEYLPDKVVKIEKTIAISVWNDDNDSKTTTTKPTQTKWLSVMSI